jgi:ATP-dependent protease ClpP protease subunit
MRGSLLPTSVRSKFQGSVVPNTKAEDRVWVSGGHCSYKINKDDNTVLVYLFGVIYHTNDYAKLITLLHTLNENQTVFFYIYSPGGSVPAACNILTAMERCRAKIITVNLGLAASCGSLLLSFGDKIAICENSITMFHNAGMGLQDSVHRASTQISHTINYTNTILFAKMRDRGLITQQEIDRIVKTGEEYYFNSDEMISRLQAGDLLYTGGLA